MASAVLYCFVIRRGARRDYGLRDWSRSGSVAPPRGPDLGAASKSFGERSGVKMIPPLGKRLVIEIFEMLALNTRICSDDTYPANCNFR
jgi:hypothetical protein